MLKIQEEIRKRHSKSHRGEEGKETKLLKRGDQQLRNEIYLLVR